MAAGNSYSKTYSLNSALARYNSDGSLDTSFGAGGQVLTFSGNTAVSSNIIVIQSDGKIIIPGYNPSTLDYALIRYNSNGSLDTSFGVDGKVDIGSGYISAVAIQSDGKILASVGSELHRYNSNGSFDTNFGSGGAVANSGGSSIAIQIDGMILASNGAQLSRYDPSGTLDPTFGVGGQVNSAASSIAIQADGKIVGAASYYNGVSYDLALMRYNSDGSTDANFGGSGTVIISVSNLYQLSPTTVMPDAATGKIFSAGYSPSNFVLCRYNSGGTPDATFGTGGKIIKQGGDYWGGFNGFVSSFVNDSALQTDGKIVLAGSTYKNDLSGDDFALARLSSNGSIDTTFGSGGTVTTGF